jgi:hypothetical protein
MSDQCSVIYGSTPHHGGIFGLAFFALVGNHSITQFVACAVLETVI